MGLDIIRKEINTIDKETKELFCKRMEQASKVAAEKAKTNDKIYKGDREKEIIARQLEGCCPDYINEYETFLKKIIQLSRKYQYRLNNTKGKNIFDEFSINTDMNDVNVSFDGSNKDISMNECIAILSDYKIVYNKMEITNKNDGYKVNLTINIDWENEKYIEELVNLLYHISEEFE